MAAITDREALVGILGLGYVGLPLALTFARGWLPRPGFDTDGRKVERLNGGESYIAHIDTSDLSEQVDGGRFEATLDASRLAEPDVLIICVPTPLDAEQQPDLSYVESTADAISPVLRSGQLVVLESTTYPGTTEELLQPRLERGGLRAAARISFSPTRPSAKIRATRVSPPTRSPRSSAESMPSRVALRRRSTTPWSWRPSRSRAPASPRRAS